MRIVIPSVLRDGVVVTLILVYNRRICGILPLQISIIRSLLLSNRSKPTSAQLLPLPPTSSTRIRTWPSVARVLAPVSRPGPMPKLMLGLNEVMTRVNKLTQALVRNSMALGKSLIIIYLFNGTGKALLQPTLGPVARKVRGLVQVRVVLLVTPRTLLLFTYLESTPSTSLMSVAPTVWTSQ